MWILYAFGSAFFAGATSILAKVGVKDVDSHVATAIRTISSIDFFMDYGIYSRITRNYRKYRVEKH